MAASNQEAFLTKVANCLGRSKPLTEPPARKEVGPPVFWREQEHFYDKTLELFKNNLEALTGRVVITSDKGEIKNQLKEWLVELGAKSVLCWDDPELLEMIEPDSLGTEVHLWNSKKTPRELIDISARVDVGITSVDYAIGYTGSMAVISKPTQGRSVSVLPPTHIAVFPRSRLVPTMSFVINDYKEQRGTMEFPSGINFITGPSRTSDIEMDLSIGVHGPFRTWVIIYDDGKK